MSPMSHQDARDLLALHALDALSPEERGALEAHLATCAECRAELASFRDATAAVGGSLSARPMAADRNARVRSRLLARAAADRGVTPIRAPRNRRLLAAAAVFLLAAIGAAEFGYDQYWRAKLLRERLAVTQHQRDSLATALAAREAFMASLLGPGVRVIDASAVSAKQPYARMFWNQPANQWTFVAYNLPATKPGRTYQLWLVTKDNKKVSAGTFAAQPNGNAVVLASYALDPGNLAAIAVTDEPSGGSAQPTTTPFLVGAAGPR
jgi:anti-sigma-K factor RskA